MVNGRTLEEEIKRIDEFFDNVSNEEFEGMILACGAQHQEEKSELKENRALKLIIMKLFNKETRGEWILLSVNFLCMILTYLFLPVAFPVNIISLVIYVFNFFLIGFFLKVSYDYYKDKLKRNSK